MWYIYGETRVSKRTFECEFFRDMLVAQNPNAVFVARYVSQPRTFLHNGHFTYPLCFFPPHVRNKIKYHVASEYLLFSVAYGWMIDCLHKVNLGNPFAQGMHDGVSLINKKSYQSMASQQIFRGTSYTLAFAFRPLREHAASVVADEFQNNFNRLTSYSTDQVFWSMISDLAALAVASVLEVEDIQKCKLHQGGKVGNSAMGLLVKSKNREVVNPFPEGVALYNKMHKLACEFSYGQRAQQLDEICGMLGMKAVRAKVDLNGTRMTSLYNLFYANLRLRPAMDMYLATETAKVKDLDTLAGMNAYDRLVSITPSDAEWQAAAEAEAGLRACKSQIVLSQTEKTYTGAMTVPVERRLRRILSSDSTHMVIVSEKTSLCNKPMRKAVEKENMSRWGRTFFDRAAEAAEERFVDTLTPHELTKTLLDLRCVKFGAQYLEDEEIASAFLCLKDAYVKWCANAHKFKYGVQPASAADPTESTSKPKTGAAAVFARMRAANVSNDPTALPYEDFAREFDIAVGNWCDYASDICFVNEFPKELEGKTEDSLDIVEDLLPLDIEKLYVRAESPDASPMFHLPMIARQRLGENMAASFCERMNSIAKDILDEGHSLLNDSELESMIILRANREFMKKVRGEWRAEIQMWANLRGLTTVVS